MINTMTDVRWERSTGRIEWRYHRPDGTTTRWFRNIGEHRPQSHADVLAIFASASNPVPLTACVREGRIERCPRCKGTGHYSGGPCFRCYGSSPASWVYID